MDTWKRLQNCLDSVATYGVLRPDFWLRYRVNNKLQQRSPLEQDEWFCHFGRREAVSREIVEFIFDHLPHYSGLQVARLQPGDRLEADLYWTEVCWFDWEMDLYDDFLCSFGRDISMEFDFGRILTVADLMRNLDQWH